MTSFGKFTLRFAAYGVVLLYLAGDLFVFYGPLYKRIQANKIDSAESIADAQRRGVAAVVYGREITLTQIDHDVRAQLSREGLPPLDSLGKEQLRLHRYAALNDLIDHELLRVKAMHSSSEFPVQEDEVHTAFARIVARFPDQSTFSKSLIATGEDKESFRARLAARIQQTKYVESRIESLVTEVNPISREDASNEFRRTLRLFETNRDRIHIRHEILK